MTCLRRTIISMMVVVMLLSACRLSAGDFSIDRYTVHTGDTVTGGVYELSAAIGQAAVGYLAGGEFEVNVGFLLPADLPVSLYTLTIASMYGVSIPPVGIYTNIENSVLTNMVSLFDVNDTTQYVCIGWSMTGNMPGTGITTNCIMTATNDAVLTWLWSTNYWLNMEVGPNGSVDLVDSWQPAGLFTTVTATADQYYHFTNWNGNVSTGDIYTNPLDILIDMPKLVAVNFGENMASNNTPEWWLASHGWTNEFDQAAMSDQDGDGMFTWEEAVAGTVPTNPVSVFFMPNVELAYGTNYTEYVYTNNCPPATNYCGEIFTQRMYEVIGNVINWSSVSGRLYAVEYCTNLIEEPFVILDGATNIHATPVLNVYTNKAHTNRQQIFYRINVRMAP